MLTHNRIPDVNWVGESVHRKPELGATQASQNEPRVTTGRAISTEAAVQAHKQGKSGAPRLHPPPQVLFKILPEEER